MTVAAQRRRGGLLLRILPPGLYAGRASKLVERSALAYSRMWLILVSGVFEPLFYLVAFQIGFGKLVDEVTGPDGRPMSYVAFVAPALLASSAMNGAIFDSTFNVFFKFRYAKTYEAMLATPIGPFDIAVGEISWAVLRGGMYAVAFFAVMTAMGLVASPWALMLIPIALLVAFAFAAIGMTCATFLRSPSQFDYVNLAVMPLFLFSTTFYPLSVYPPVLQVVVQCFPLYHGIELMREFAVGTLSWSMLGHLAYLLALAVLGVWGVARRLTRLLLR
ncbi:ABC transporter permease [Amycolatopsis sp. K13G38]|uniref:Transport permease protein n=1 Tax=Amycolatopsis acididurans TaxID=2724524 RepID=A0ABX1JJ93_9PSEU|nr:ABC transporter permease [Amycolatopsis acididurans]NKQ58899.1 ABC transporter permease [Amycolatopsis acididurans]